MEEIIAGIVLTILTIFGVIYLWSQRVDVDKVREKTAKMTPEEKKKYDEKTVNDYITWTNVSPIVMLPIIWVSSISGFYFTEELLAGNIFGISENYSYLWLIFGLLVTISLVFSIFFEYLRSPTLFHAQNNNRRGWWSIMMYFGLIAVVIYRRKYMKPIL